MEPLAWVVIVVGLVSLPWWAGGPSTRDAMKRRWKR